MADLVGATEVEETGKWKERRKVYVDTNVSPQRVLDAFVLVDQTGAQTGIASNPLITNAEMKIGNTVTDGTEGSILFVGASAVLGQDNANLFWNDTDNRLGVGISVPLTAIHVDSNAANTVAIATLENTAGNIQIFRSDATPEAAITGSIGDLAIDGTGGKIYLKQTGSSTNTGWSTIGLGLNLTSITNDILSDTGTLLLGGTGGTNNENLTFDFESISNRVTMGSGTGISSFLFQNMDLRLSDEFNFNFGNGSDVKFKWETIGNQNFQVGLITGLSTSSGYVSIMEQSDIGNANRSPLATSADPVFRIYSSDATSALDYLEFFHDQVDPNISWANGILSFNKAGDDLDLRISGSTIADLFCVNAGTDRIGIGTNAPTTMLHIAPASGIAQMRLEGAGTGIVFTDTSGSAGSFDLNFNNNLFSLESTQFTLNAVSGNVGIGTSTASTRLHVDSNAADTVPILTVENTGGDFQVFRDDASPESVITGSPGDLCIDGTGGDAYIKKTGAASNTGWLRLNTNGLVLQTAGNTLDPADSTTYFTGGNAAIAPSTTATIQKIHIPKTGTVTSIYVFVLNIVPGSTETSTISFRLNDTTDTAISAVVQNDLTTETFSNTGLSIAVTAGDFFEIKWVTPAWVTNPTGVFISASVYIE